MMKKVGGNIEAIVQRKASVPNRVGEGVPTWNDLISIKGWLDSSSGDSRYTTYNAKIQESSHVFIMDYDEAVANLKSEDVRLKVKDKVYDVTFIDNPMELNYHLEIFLKFKGGQ